MQGSNEITASAAAVSLVTTATTSVVSNTLPSDSGPLGPGQGVCISGYFNLTTGTGTTAVTVKVIGSVSGQIGTTDTITIGAAVSDSIPYEKVDQSGVLQTYTVQIAQTGASGNGTVNNVTESVRLVNF